MPAPTLLYQVTAEIADPADRDAYLAWLAGGHLADVVAGGALSGQAAWQPGGDGEPDRVVCSYRFESAAAFARYEAGPAPALRAEGVSLFGPDSGRSVVWSRFVGEVTHAAGETDRLSG